MMDFLILVVGFVLLVKGSDWFVDGAAGIANKFGIPQIVIGLTIVAMGTSAPEAAVSISAALGGNADISVGNVVGSNIMNILVILGLTATIVPIAVKKNTVNIEMPYMIITTIVFLVMALIDGNFNWVDGIIMWAMFIIYLAYLFMQTKKNKAAIAEGEAVDGEEEQETKTNNIWLMLVMAVIGAACIVLGSNFAVDGATGIAEKLGISDRIIGLTVVALGTSLPELFASVTAAIKGNADIAIGNIVGSNIFNILFVLGTSALIVPINYGDMIRDTIIAIAAAVLLLLCVIKGKKLTRPAGILMLISYVLYFVFVLL